MNIRYPNITGKTPAEQIAQLRGFLYQLVDQLNIEAVSGGAVAQQTLPSAEKQGGDSSRQTPEQAAPMQTFNQIKSLIIKSAEIVNAYFTEINRRLEGVYVAESAFGSYKKETAQTIKENADSVDRVFSSIQQLEGALDQMISTNAYIRSGLLFTVGEETLEPELGQELENGTDVFGVEVGQVTKDAGGVEVFHKFARFTSYGMTLYDDNGNLSAYITDSRLNIPNAVIKNSLVRGGFVETIYADGSSVERWAGV